MKYVAMPSIQFKDFLSSSIEYGMLIIGSVLIIITGSARELPGGPVRQITDTSSHRADLT